MMKNRSFLFGLGTGLIIGALLLQLMISGGAAPLTKEQVLKGAEQLNLKLVEESSESSESSPKEAPLDEVDQDKKAADSSDSTNSADNSQKPVEPSAPAVAASPSPVASPKTSESIDKAVSPTKPSEPAKPVEDSVGKPKDATNPTPKAPDKPEVKTDAVISLRIPDGSTLTDTANILSKNGVVKDKDIFLKEANKRKINKKIQTGSYSFIKGESIDSIIEKLISFR